VKRDVKWLLVTSLIMFFWSTWSTLMMTGYYFIAGPWYYLRNITVLSFVITISLATLYTTNFWKAEPIFKATIVMFIISISLFFISNMQWITYILGTSPY
jgi:hypothetical protein